MFSGKKVAVVLNSQPLADIEEKDLLCADGAYSKIVGTESNIWVLGDFDSLREKLPEGIKTVVCPVDKDYIDGEKALRFAYENGAEAVTVYGADGGRLDMQFANFALLKIAFDLGLQAEIKTCRERVFYSEKGFCKKVQKGCTVSVLPYGGSVSFSDSCGLAYSLRGLTLTPADTVGLSNRATEETIEIAIEKGGAFLFITERKEE